MCTVVTRTAINIQAEKTEKCKRRRKNDTRIYIQNDREIHTHIIFTNKSVCFFPPH